MIWKENPQTDGLPAQHSTQDNGTCTEWQSGRGVQEPRQNSESMHGSAQSAMKTYSRVGKTAKQFRVTAGMAIWHKQGDLASKL